MKRVHDDELRKMIIKSVERANSTAKSQWNVRMHYYVDILGWTRDLLQREMDRYEVIITECCLEILRLR